MPNPIETDFKLALALGRLAGRWGQAEFAVEMIYITLSEMPHRKATISFSFHKAVATQKDIIFLLADETSWIEDEERAVVKAVIKEFADMSAKRNGWIHYPFGVDTSSGDAEVYKAKRMKKGDILYAKEPADQKLITAFANQVSDLTVRLHNTNMLLMRAFERKLRQQLQRHTPSTWTLSPRDLPGLLSVLSRPPQSSEE